ncbi:MAG: DUF2341 domain-containing protein, partial [Candidatus Dojkabacteria bacterium]|nr:DUF2341 domain-containing protein [Candidatus Dojkabacteria bacterium]
MKYLKKNRILFLLFSLLFIGLGVFLGYNLVTQVKAVEKSWIQEDWSGIQTDDIISENGNSYKFESNLSLSTELTIKEVEVWSSTYPEWLYRRKITFDNTESNLGVISEKLINFPVLIKLEDGVNINYSSCKSNGEDLRFEGSDGTELAYEIESWDSSGISYIWVKVPQISQNSDTDYIYLYYGNSSVSDGQNPVEVWSNGYAGVWHMNSDPEVSDILDSLGSHNGTPTGGMSSDQLVDGLNGKGLDFSASNTIELGSSELLKPSNITLESWVKVEYFTYYLGIISSMPGWGSGFSLHIHPNMAGAMVSGTYLYSATIDPEINVWYHVVATHNDENEENILYVDGISERSSIRDVSYVPGAVTTIGCFYTTGSLKFNGIIDEIRISNTVRSPAWIAATHVGEEESDSFCDYANEETKYYQDGYLESNIFDTGHASNWGAITYTTSYPDAISVRVKSSNSSTMEGTLAWSTCQPLSSGATLTDNDCIDNEERYIQYRIEFDMTDQITTPVFESVSITYAASDQTDPDVNAHGVQIDDDVESGQWINFAPTIRWSEGNDDSEGKGLLGYYISLSEVGVNIQGSGAEPSSSSGKLAGIGDGIDEKNETYITSNTYIDLSTIESLELETNKKYFISIQAVDLAGNYWKKNTEGYRDLLSFKYDNTKPNNVMYISTPSSTFGSINDMFFNWPVSGSAMATDLQSNILGWQYAINSTDSEKWRGTTYHDFLKTYYIPQSSGLSSILLDEDIHGEDIIVGNNTIYFRSIDNAGNVSTYATGGINYGGKAPKFLPESVVTVTPASSESNNFALSWPTAEVDEEKTLKSYYYMINTQPPTSASTLSSNPSIYRPTLSTFVGQSLLTGAVNGENHVYVVAVDSDDNYSPTNAIHGTFILDSDLPEPPLNFSLSDTSIKEAELWRVALTWEEPEYIGNGNISYIIEKSLNGTSWVELDRIKGNAYSDISTASREYYYRVGTVDSSDESLNNPRYSFTL